MPAPLLAVLLWLCAAAIVVAQVMILRSTARAWRAGQAAGDGANIDQPGPSALERAFAFGPAIVLAIVLWLSWRAATAPVIIEVDLRGTAPTSVRL
jgi:hypothetical protein